MPGKFDGLTDAQWEIIEPLLPGNPVEPVRGRPHSPFRYVLNTILWVLITGARWIDIPSLPHFAARSTSHRWLGIWSNNGTLERIISRLQGMAQDAGLIDWERCSVDGAFAAGKGGGETVQYGRRGKGVTLHALVDGNGTPLSVVTSGAAESERAQVKPLLDAVNVRTGRRGRPSKLPDALQGDRGYDSRELRNTLRRRGVKPMIPRRVWPDRKPPRGRPPATPIDRWKVERTFSWFQRKFRRLVVRWERRNVYWDGFVSVAVCMFWVNRLLS